MLDLEERLHIIEARNTRVEYDKAWETSFIRRSLIAGITYGCSVILLSVMGHDGVLKHALVPVMGYLLSTFSLPPIKKLWIEKQKAKQ
jgi:hypothetical protein